jgi:hypothetical protein
MRVATTKSMCDLLFKNLPKKPVNILGQESCDKTRFKDDHGNESYKK